MKSSIAILAVTPLLLAAGVIAQQAAQLRQSVRSRRLPKTGLPDTPQVFGTEALRYRVVPIKGLVTPVGAGVSAERRHPGHRAARAPADHPQGRARSAADRRPA